MEISIRLTFFSCLHVFSNVCLLSDGQKPAGMLYPRDSESRSLRHLDGMWNFMLDDSASRHESFDNKWYSNRLSQFGDVLPMPVPSSYNDITNSKLVRDFVGWAWYDRELYMDKTWSPKRIVLRIDSAHYNAIVWVNGQEAVKHEGGHLPFEAEVTQFLNMGASNYVTVAINNTLTPTTLPPGAIEYKTNPEKYPPGYFVQNLQMDFFNYAGIHRHVTLYSTPKTFIEDIDITTNIQGNDGTVSFLVYTSGQSDLINVKVEVIDKQGHVVAVGNKYKDTLTIRDANFWWPYTMNSSSPGYLYTLKVTVADTFGEDVYRQPFGIRTVSVTNTRLLINEKPFYCHGVNKHEDSDIRGKGLDFALIARDFNMLKWLGVNCFRTSHYPYAEEIMDQADQQGIVVIDESPGVGISKTKRLRSCRYKNEKIVCGDNIKERKKKKNKKEKEQSINQKFDTLKTVKKISNGKKRKSNRSKIGILDSDDNFSNKSLEHHKAVMTEMYQRDKNRPSVIMWSVANEPATNKAAAGPYFREVIEHVRSLDSTRPVTFVCNQDYNTDVAVQYVDIILVNRYYAWYSDVGHTELIQLQLENDLRHWHQTFNMPVIVSEYGADTVAGFHQEPSFVFTEEYQREFLQEYHKVFDKLRSEFLVGEMPWNFADFMTLQGITRVVGNKKGLLTRQRQPKMSGHLIRDRYTRMANGNVCTL